VEVKLRTSDAGEYSGLACHRCKGKTRDAAVEPPLPELALDG